MHEALKPWQPSGTNPWDFDAALHLWRRAGFGAPPGRVEATLKTPPAMAVRRIVDGPARDKPVEELEAILESALGTGDPDTARAWLLMRMVRSEHQLREKMALFWHGHFATSIAKVRHLSWMMRQYRLFLDHGLGRFAKLLDGATKDPAMIRWLDNETNSKGQPNENYARELFELFTLGVGNYTEKDIQEAGRAFTGWRILHDRFHVSQVLHDNGVKTVLGVKGNLGGEEICRIALEQEACGRFLAHKLLAFFCVPKPDPAVVASLGAEMKRSGYDIAATIELLLGSRLFFAKTTRRALIKSPTDFVIGAMRSLDARVSTTKTVVPLLREMGQDLLAPPNVKGWPGHRDWINTASWLTRVHAARALANNLKPNNQQPLEALAHSLLGHELPDPERQTLGASGANRTDLAHALLSLPEAHLA